MSPFGCDPAGATGGPPTPGRRNADVEGASLIGVPTVGVAGAPSSSTFMRDTDVVNPVNEFDAGVGLAASPGDDAGNSREAEPLKSCIPSIASACAGSWISSRGCICGQC